MFIILLLELQEDATTVHRYSSDSLGTGFHSVSHVHSTHCSFRVSSTLTAAEYSTMQWMAVKRLMEDVRNCIFFILITSSGLPCSAFCS